MSEFEKYSLLISGIQATVLTLAFIIAWFQLKQLTRDSRTSLELASRERAMNLIARYSDHAFTERRYKLRTDVSAQADRLQCAYVLNFLEELGMVVKHGIANEELLKDFFGTILEDWLEQKYIRDTLDYYQENKAAFFENVSWLQERWGKRKTHQPTIPPIPPPGSHSKKG
jgi:hypothetical protein